MRCVLRLWNLWSRTELWKFYSVQEEKNTSSSTNPLSLQKNSFTCEGIQNHDQLKSPWNGVLNRHGIYAMKNSSPTPPPLSKKRSWRDQFSHPTCSLGSNFLHHISFNNIQHWSYQKEGRQQMGILSSYLGQGLPENIFLMPIKQLF